MSCLEGRGDAFRRIWNSEPTPGLPQLPLTTTPQCSCPAGLLQAPAWGSNYQTLQLGISHILGGLIDTSALGDAFYTQNPKTALSHLLQSWLSLVFQAVNSDAVPQDAAGSRAVRSMTPPTWQVLPGTWLWANDTQSPDPSFFLVLHPWRSQGWVLRSF